MRATELLNEFIDDELLRAPMTVDLVVDAVLSHWRTARGAAPPGRQDPAWVLKNQRGDLVAQATRALRLLVADDLQAVEAAGPVVPGDRAAAIAAASVPAALSRPSSQAALGPATGAPRPPNTAALALIDEDAVASDIALSRCIEAVRLHAENELRELNTYTAALVGDDFVSRDTNPFRPELFVRALWQGVQALPLPRSSQSALMRDAAQPLARTLKMAYGAAVGRLDQRGVTPASHRTIVMTGSSHGRMSTRPRPPSDLNRVRDSLPLLPMPPLPTAGAAEQVGHVDSIADPQLIDLLTRLFDEIRADQGLPRELGALLQRLQVPALRVALKEPALLDSYDHPVWRFMDVLSHSSLYGAAEDRQRVLGLARNLVAHLVGADISDGSAFRWAIDRVTALNRHALEQAQQAALPEFERLQRLAAQHLAPLDIATLDTVPAALLPETRPQGTATLPLAPGDHVHAYLQGRWRFLQLLLVDESLPLWLLREPDDEEPRLWPVRPAAIERLLAERLAKPLRVRSLVRRAADRVLRAI